MCENIDILVRKSFFKILMFLVEVYVRIYCVFIIYISVMWMWKRKVGIFDLKLFFGVVGKDFDFILRLLVRGGEWREVGDWEVGRVVWEGWFLIVGFVLIVRESFYYLWEVCEFWFLLCWLGGVILVIYLGGLVNIGIFG